VEHETWQWGESTYLDHVAWASGYAELCAWDAAGPLLLDKIPGLVVAPPSTEKWLFVASPILCGVSGDLQGIWRVTGLQQYSCPWCLARSPCGARTSAAAMLRRCLSTLRT
jgi:hypothetical protein